MSSKDTNPKDAIGVRKWRTFATIPGNVMAELGTAMLEGAVKYGRHNYRVAGVRASVYYDAAMGHLVQWWEGEDCDPDPKSARLSHITKAIASLVILRDAMLNDKLNDDRPPRSTLPLQREDLQAAVDRLFKNYPEPKEPYTQKGVKSPLSDLPRAGIPAIDPTLKEHLDRPGVEINLTSDDPRFHGKKFTVSEEELRSLGDARGNIRRGSGADEPFDDDDIFADRKSNEPFDVDRYL